MAFLKKSRTVAQELEMINIRIEELVKKRDGKAKDLAERKADAGRLLASMAVSDSEENQKSLALARKAVERLEESHSDLDEQIRILTETRGQLGTEILKARVRELPDLVTKEATAFNAIFDEAVKAVELLREVQHKMMERQNSYKNLTGEYNACCRSLDLTVPLEVLGLGALANQGSPYGSSFVVPEQTETFCASVIIYQSKIEASKNFQVENPDYEKQVGETAAKDAQPYKWGPLRDFRKFGENIR